MIRDLTQLLPEESVAGYLIRRATAHGDDLGALWSGLVGPFPYFGRTMLGLRIVPKITNRSAAALQCFASGLGVGIGRSHTIGPLFAPLTGQDVVAAMGRVFEKRRHAPSFYKTTALRPLRHCPTYARLQYCYECFTEQVHQFGTAYLRREWTIPYVRHCPHHGVPLRGLACSKCGEGETPGQIEYLFRQTCRSCSADRWEDDGERSKESSLIVDKWFVDMLRKPIPYLNQKSRDACVELTTERLELRPTYLDKDHVCSSHCEEVSCSERCYWLADHSGRLTPQSARHHMRLERSRHGTGPFLLFWLPIIHSFVRFSRFSAVLGFRPSNNFDDTDDQGHHPIEWHLDRASIRS